MPPRRSRRLKLYRYRAYGLALASELPLPELTAGGSGADVLIRFGAVLPIGHTEQEPGYIGGDANTLYYHWPHMATIAVRDGREIVIDCVPGASQCDLRIVLLGPVLAGLLFQRGLYLLHAGAVRMGAGAVAFAAPSGGGKSTIVGALRQQGHALIADDVAAIDPSTASVLPGFPQQRFWPDTAARLGHDVDSLPLVHPSVAKRSHRVTGSMEEKVLPLRRIYLLTYAPQVDSEPLSPTEALLALVRNSFVVRGLAAGDNLARHFVRCTALAGTVPVHCLRRPHDLTRLSAAVRLVETDMAEQG